MALTLISGPDVLTTAANEIAIKVNTDVAGARLQCILAFESAPGSGSFTELVNMWADPNDDGDCTFYVNDVAKSSFKGLYDAVPSTPVATVTTTDYCMKAWRWAVWEHSGTPATVTDTVDIGTANRYSLRGGIAKLRHKQMPWFDTLPDGWFYSGGAMPLDHLGTRAYIGMADIAMIPVFIWVSSGSGWFLRVVCTWSDGSTSTHDALVTSFSVVQNGVVLIPVGPENLGLSALAPTGENLISYTVQAKHPSGGVALHGLRTYVIDHNAYRTTNTLVYVNALGAWTYLHLRGRLIRSTDAEKAQYEKYWNNDSALSDGMSETVVERVTESRTIASGYARTKREHQLYAELTVSPRIYLKEGDDLIPVTCKGVKWAHDMDANLSRADVELEVAYDDQVPDMLYMDVNE